VVAVDLVLAPLVAGFALSGSDNSRPGPTLGLAVGCALAAWVGVGVHHVLLPYPAGQCRALNASTEFADLACIARGLVWAAGSLLAVVTGLAGGALHLALTQRLE